MRSTQSKVFEERSVIAWHLTGRSHIEKRVASLEVDRLHACPHRAICDVGGRKVLRLPGKRERFDVLAGHPPED